MLNGFGRIASIACAFALASPAAWAQGLNNPTTVTTTGSLDPIGIACADFDGDGVRELVVSVSEGATNQIELFENNGTGTFTSVGVVAAPPGATNLNYVKAGNINGTGFLDVVVACQGAAGAGGDGIAVFVNTSPVGGPISFAADVFYATTNVDPTRLVVGQFNGVGNDDVVCASFDFTTPETDACRLLHSGGGPGAFYGAGTNIAMPIAETPVCVATGDLDGDGDLDLVFGIIDGAVTVACGVALFTNNGAGVFANAPGSPFATSAGNDWATDVAIANFNGGGVPDVAGLVFPNPWAATQRMDVWLNAPALTLALVAGSPFPLGPGDVNNNVRSSMVTMNVDSDGDIDVVASYTSGTTIRVYTNDGSGVFGTSTALTSGGFTVDLASGDINGDGLDDLVAADTTANGILIYKQIGLPGSGTGPKNKDARRGWLPNFCAAGVRSETAGPLALSLIALAAMAAAFRRS